MTIIRILFSLVLGTLASLSVAAQEKPIVIAATDWEPYTSAVLPDGGFLTAISVAALRRVGYRPQVEIVPWVRALEGTKEGTYDALLGASYTEERTRFFHYPAYAYPNQAVLFARAGGPRRYDTLADLCPATVGVLRGSFLVDLLKQESCLVIEPSSDVRTNVRKLLHERIDLMVDSRTAVLYYLAQEEPGQLDLLHELEPPFTDDQVFMVLSKQLPDHEAIALDYERGIEMIKADGTFDEI